LPTSSADGRWAQVKRVVADAVEGGHRAGSAWVAAACEGDAALQREVESLLAAHQAAGGGFLETPEPARPGAAAALAEVMGTGPPTLPADRRIGPYRVLAELGQGGMGTVYLAERADAAFEKKVAIKIAHGGVASSSLGERFRDERHILARLDHPNIARLLDGGTTDDGQPYVVMEYVDGVPLDVHCDRRGLDVPRRLELFRLVCAAVQYAHQRLVVHRDLKARNILVTSDGTPKLLDFGIAKLLEPGGAAAFRTRTGFRPLTPEAASPEQLRGEPLTVTSDVYSLGVLLYRLLTGRSPHPAAKGDLELMRAICEDVPPAPTSVAPPERRPKLGRELDWIVGKALRKEPERRYPSVEQLADDLARHAGGRPVRAAPDSWAYRARKFIGRHRVPVLAAGLSVVSLLGGLAAAAWQAHLAEEQRQRAERRFADVRRLATSFLFEFHDAIENLPGSTPARALVVRRALEYLDGLAAEARADRSLQRELASAYERVGGVQGNPLFPNLGDSQGALASYRKSLAIRERLAASAPQDPQLRLELAEACAQASEVVRVLGDPAEALRLSSRALSAYEALAPARAQDPRFLGELVERTYARATLLRETGEVAGALGGFRRAAELSRRLIELDSGQAAGEVHLATSLDGIGGILHEQGDLAGAIENRQRTLEIRERLLARSPQDSHYQRQLGFAHHNLGLSLMEAGRLEPALEQFRTALEVFEALRAKDPADAQGRRNVSVALKQIGDLLLRLDRRAEARARYQEALRIDRALAAADPASVQARLDLSFSEGKYGAALAAAGSQRAGRRLMQEGLQAQEALAAAEPANDLLLVYLANSHLRLAESWSPGERAAAVAEYEKAIELRQVFESRHPDSAANAGSLAEARANAARLYARLGDRRRALELYASSLEAWSALERAGRLTPRDQALRATASREQAALSAP